MNMKAAMTAIKMPTATGEIFMFLDSNTDENAAPIEFDCTIFPIKPSASTINMAKSTARNLPNFPLNACLM